MGFLSLEHGECWKEFSTHTQFRIEVLFDCTSACSSQVFLENLGTRKIINHKTQISTEYEVKRFYKAVRLQQYSDETLQTTENNWHPFCQDPESTDGSDCPLPASSGPGPHAIQPEPSSPAPVIPQQGLSPVHHSPALPTHGICWAGPFWPHPITIPREVPSPEDWGDVLLMAGTGMGLGCLMEIPMEMAHREP